mmetsp:Transcript_11253/g.23052  ORF Transcript_11253/g.23052 Transcript_11253/m.23052 type:complete len:302 (+) Transcript_11253:63-968(+)
MSPPPPSLPLDWTRVGSRKREACCVQESGVGGCRHRRRGPTSSSSSSGSNTTTLLPQSSLPLHATTTTTTTTTTTPTGTVLMTIRGTAVVCLLDCTDPQWFQGYLFFHDTPSSSSSSSSSSCWSMLGVQKEIDECLQCSEGGYRVLDLKVNVNNKQAQQNTSSSSSSSSSSQCTTAKPVVTTFRDVEWTGGDMMQLSHPQLSMQAQKLLTGMAAVPVVESVFGGLLRRVRENTNNNNDEDDDNDNDNMMMMMMDQDDEQPEQPQPQENDGDDDHVLDMFPDLAIVVGHMQLTLTTTTTTKE